MNEKEVIIKGGATLWARQTIESEIFLDKPDKWFKIWFYLVNRVSHKDTKRYKRGETFFQQEWVCEATGATPDQLKKCLSFLRKNEMIGTRRSTRGTWLKVCKYSHYQRLDNYYYSVKAPDKARQKHDRSTTEARRYNKNDKNDKNDKNNIIYTSYKKLINSNAKDTDNAKDMIKARLKNFSEKELLQAMDTKSKDEWFMQNCANRGMTWFFESKKRIGRYIEEEPKEKIKNFID